MHANWITVIILLSWSIQFHNVEPPLSVWSAFLGYLLWGNVCIMQLVGCDLTGECILYRRLFLPICNLQHGSCTSNTHLYVCPSICLTGFVEPTLCTTLLVQGYVMHHRPAFCTMVHKGGAYFLRIRDHQQHFSCMLSTTTLMVHNVVLSV